MGELEGMDRRLDGKSQDDSDDCSEDEAKPEANVSSRQAGQKAPERKRFTEEELAKAREQVDQMMENDGEFLDCSVSGALTVHSVEAAAAAPLATGTSAPSGIGRRKKKQVASTAPTLSASKPAPTVENPWDNIGSGESAVND